MTLTESIEWARDHITTMRLRQAESTMPRSYDQEIECMEKLVAAAEQVERAKFSSTELIEAGDANFKIHKNSQRTRDDGFEDAFYSGFNLGAAWVLHRMMKGEG